MKTVGQHKSGPV